VLGLRDDTEGAAVAQDTAGAPLGDPELEPGHRVDTELLEAIDGRLTAPEGLEQAEGAGG
jgi:hypothetical protein